MNEINEEVAEEMLHATENYMRTMTEIVMRHEVEDSYGEMMMVNLSTIIENMTTREEDIVKFVNNFVEFMNSQKKAGDLEPRSQFENLEEAREGWEDFTGYVSEDDNSE